MTLNCTNIFPIIQQIRVQLASALGQCNDPAPWFNVVDVSSSSVHAGLLSGPTLEGLKLLCFPLGPFRVPFP